MPVVMKLGEPDKDTKKSGKAAKPTKAASGSKPSIGDTLSEMDSKTKIIAGVVGAVVLLGLVWVLFLRGGGDETPAADSPSTASSPSPNVAPGATQSQVDSTASGIASPATKGRGAGAGAGLGDEEPGIGGRGNSKTGGGEGF